jgi:hypothetical protein
MAETKSRRPLADSTAVHDQVYEAIRQRLITGRIAPGVGVSLRSLAAELGTSADAGARRGPAAGGRARPGDQSGQQAPLRAVPDRRRGWSSCPKPGCGSSRSWRPAPRLGPMRR